MEYTDDEATDRPADSRLLRRPHRSRQGLRVWWPQRACCSGPTCTSPAFCNARPSTACSPTSRRAPADSDCFFGHCEDTSATPSCGSPGVLERHWPSLPVRCRLRAGHVVLGPQRVHGGLRGCFVACARPRGGISVQCDNITNVCMKGIPVAIGDGCIANGDCHDASMTCCVKGKPVVQAIAASTTIILPATLLPFRIRGLLGGKRSFFFC